EDPAGPEGRDALGERRREAPATVAIEEGRERTFLFVRVGVAHHGRRLVVEAHHEIHESNVRRSPCGSIEEQLVDQCTVDGGNRTYSSMSCNPSSESRMTSRATTPRVARSSTRRSNTMSSVRSSLCARHASRSRSSAKQYAFHE